MNRQSPRANFDNLLWAYTTVVQITVGEKWQEVEKNIHLNLIKKYLNLFFFLWNKNFWIKKGLVFCEKITRGCLIRLFRFSKSRLSKLIFALLIDNLVLSISLCFCIGKYPDSNRKNMTPIDQASEAKFDLGSC